MKMPEWKERDRALSARADGFRVLWDSQNQGTYNVGRNKAKRERRALSKQWRSGSRH